jgi:hypothetical protein
MHEARNVAHRLVDESLEQAAVCIYSGANICTKGTSDLSISYFVTQLSHEFLWTL